MFRFPPLTPLVKKLILGVAGCFVALVILERFLGIEAFGILALSPVLGVHTIWQVVTHVLVYPVVGQSVMSLAVSLLFFWWMASPFEQRFGATRLLQVLALMTLASGLAGALFGTIFIVLGVPVAPVVMAGIGPLVIGILCAQAYTYPPGTQLRPFGLFSLSRNAIIIGFLALSVLMNIADANYPAVFGDLAAAGSGMYFVRWMLRPRAPKPTRQKTNGKTRRPAGWKVIDGGADDDDDDDRPRYLN